MLALCALSCTAPTTDPEPQSGASGQSLTAKSTSTSKIDAGSLTVYVTGKKPARIANDQVGNTLPLVDPTADLASSAASLMNVVSAKPVTTALGMAVPQSRLVFAPERSSWKVFRFQQVAGGIPIVGAELVVKIAAAGNIQVITSHLAPKIEVAPTKSAVPAEEAAAKAEMHYVQNGIERSERVGKGSLPSPAPNTADRNAGQFEIARGPNLYLVRSSLIKAARTKTGYTLAYRVDAEIDDGSRFNAYRYWVDAHTGRVLARYSLLMHAQDRNTYDAQGSTTLDYSTLVGASVLKKDQLSNVFPYAGGDPNIEEAHVFAGDTYDYFFNQHGRDGYDDLGATIESFVHYGSSYNNAAWYSVGEFMFYGDGDGTYFTPLTGSPEVVAHEITHAVTTYTANLEYLGQSGAMNESFSDVFGKFSEFYNAGFIANWLIGDEIVGPYFTSTLGYGGMRDMQDPTFGTPFSPGPSATNQPDHMEDFYYAVPGIDNAGVHTNSGILNKAAYLLSAGGTHHGIAVAGLSVSNTEILYYEALTTCLPPDAEFWQLRECMTQACSTSSGLTVSTAACENSVGDAFDAVGISLVFIMDPVRNQYINVTTSSPYYTLGSVPAQYQSGALINWILEYSVSGSGTWSFVTSGSSMRPIGSTLGFWNLLTVPDGKIDLRLTANYAGNTVTHEIPLYIDQLLASGWPADVDDQGSVLTLKSPMIEDLDGDGQNELIFGAAVFNADGTIKAGWTNEPGAGRSNPAIVDIDADPELELIMCDYETLGEYNTGLPNDGGPVIYAYNHDKTVIWSYDVVHLTSPYPAASISTIATADVDNDGELEAVFNYHSLYDNPLEDSELFILDAATGAEELRMTVPGRTMTSLALADLDGDGASEIIMSTELGLFVFYGDGTDYPGWPYTLPPATFLYYGSMASPTVGDVDQDGDYEILMKNHMWNDDGTLLTGWPSAYTYSFNGIFAPFADGDPELEVAQGNTNSVVFSAFEDDASTIGTRLDLGENLVTIFAFAGAVDNTAQGAPGAVDVDGDCEPEIVAPGPMTFVDGRPLPIYGGESSLPSSFPTNFPRYVESPFAVMSAPAVGDLDGDGYSELAIGAGHKVYVWSLGTEYKEGGNPWSMLGHDTSHTGLFNGWATHGEIYGILTHQTNYTGLLEYSAPAVMSMIVDSLNAASPAPAQTSFVPGPGATGNTASEVHDILESHPEILPFSWTWLHDTSKPTILYQIAYWQDANGIAAAVPTRGDYKHWVAIEGAAAAAAPICADMSYYSLKGFWVDDPLDGKSFKTAAEWNSTYYLPTNGSEYEAVIEPPETTGTVEVWQAKTHAMPKMASVCGSSILADMAKTRAAEGIKEFHLMDDEHFKAAFLGAEVGDPVRVTRTDGESPYFLVPFYRQESTVLTGGGATTKSSSTVLRRKVVARVNAVTGQFLEARYRVHGSLDFPPEVCSLYWHQGIEKSPFHPNQPGQTCKEYATWKNSSFKAGETVAADGMVYACKDWPFDGWCGQKGYEPGVDRSWESAWDLVATCAPVQKEERACAHLSTWQPGRYAAGDQVRERGQVYECKPWPYTRWCSQEAFRPGSSDHWESAWYLLGSCSTESRTQGAGR